MKESKDLKVINLSKEDLRRGALDDATSFSSKYGSVDVLSELRENLKQVQKLQAQLHFMAQEIKDSIRKR